MSEDDSEAKHLKFGLLDNALDDLESAAEAAKGSTQREWKRALTNLVSGIELLLKAKLYNEHWTLVLANVSKEVRDGRLGERVRSEDFISAGWGDCIGRIKEVCSRTFTADELETLEAIRKYQNRVKHFTIEVDYETLVAHLARAFRFAREFCSDDLSLSKADRVLRCGLCLQSAFVVGRGREIMPACLFCELTVERDSLAYYLGFSEISIGFCSICFSPTNVPDWQTTNHDDMYCIVCGTHSRRPQCLVCKVRFIPKHFPTQEHCDTCLEAGLGR